MGSGEQQKWRKKQLEEATEMYNKSQIEVNKAGQALQQLTTQLTENTSVQEEFNLLGATAKVFKQVGPVLIPQDLEEAKSNVQKRLDWIGGEIKRMEDLMKLHQENLEKQKEVIIQVRKEAIESQGLTTASRK